MLLQVICTHNIYVVDRSLTYFHAQAAKHSDKKILVERYRGLFALCDKQIWIGSAEVGNSQKASIECCNLPNY